MSPLIYRYAFACTFAASFAHALSISNRATITQLSNGTTIEYGETGVPDGIKEWQSTGILYKGCSNTAAAISNCYNLTLTSNPNEQLDPNFLSSPRQRIELRGDSHTSGSSYSFQWKQFLASSVGTSTHFFHLMQVFDETADGPVVTLDAVSNKLSIKDYATDRTDCGGTCPSVALTNYNGITTLHSMTVTFGPSGSLSYKVTNAKSGATILSYSATGAMGGDSAYLKFGTYRATFTGMTASDAAVGDFTYTEL